MTVAPPLPPEHVEDPDDPRVALFRDVRERDLVGRSGLFIAEGLSVLTVLLTRSRIETLAILVDERRADRLPILERRGTAPLYLASQAVLDAIAGFPLHRGILAAGRVPEPARLTAVLSDGPLRLPLLVGLSNHDNVGGVYRNAAAFGAAAVAIDGGTADPFYRKAIRVGVGAPLVIPTVRVADVVDACARLHDLDVAPYALTPRADRTVGSVPLAPRAAFLLGTEGAGLPEPVLAAAEPMGIAMAPGLDSLNVAAASAIALHAHYLAHGPRVPRA